jgi:hypothetical protein
MVVEKEEEEEEVVVVVVVVEVEDDVRELSCASISRMICFSMMGRSL